MQLFKSYDIIRRRSQRLNLRVNGLKTRVNTRYQLDYPETLTRHNNNNNNSRHEAKEKMSWERTSRESVNLHCYIWNTYASWSDQAWNFPLCLFSYFHECVVRRLEWGSCEGMSLKGKLPWGQDCKPQLDKNHTTLYFMEWIRNFHINLRVKVLLRTS